jgi:rfaE bifunctional protein nucleotidyltransferase chain/domain
MDNLVLTTGTFNIVHAGHIELFDFCSEFGKVCVGVNSDRYLLQKYGSKAIPVEKRLKVLKSLKQIQEIYVFDEDTPISLIEKLQPDIYVKGPDYLNVKIPEIEILTKLNIKYLIPNSEKILSTSSIIS